MIRVSCEFHVPLGRIDAAHYIRPLELSVLGWDRNGVDFVLGKIGADMLLLLDAQMDGVSVFDVCDQDSQGMYELYEALFEKDDEFQQELGVDEVTNHVLFLWRSVFHPKLRPYQDAIVNVLCEMFGHECVAIMWRDFTVLEDKELAELGFRKIAGTDFVFRHVALATRFGDDNPRGVDTPFEFTASQSDEDWVMRRWKKDGGAADQPGNA